MVRARGCMVDLGSVGCPPCDRSTGDPTGFRVGVRGASEWIPSHPLRGQSGWSGPEDWARSECHHVRHAKESRRAPRAEEASVRARSPDASCPRRESSRPHPPAPSTRVQRPVGRHRGRSHLGASTGATHPEGRRRRSRQQDLVQVGQQLRLVSRDRGGRLSMVTSLDECGNGAPYRYPVGGRRDPYFKLPFAYWTSDAQCLPDPLLPRKSDASDQLHPQARILVA